VPQGERPAPGRGQLNVDGPEPSPPTALRITLLPVPPVPLEERARELVAKARGHWLEHHRLRPLCAAAFDAANGLQSDMTDALQAARDAEAELSQLLQVHALEAHRGPSP
jgi:hypothetical protein